MQDHNHKYVYEELMHAQSILAALQNGAINQNTCYVPRNVCTVATYISWEAQLLQAPSTRLPLHERKGADLQLRRDLQNQVSVENALT